MENTHWLEVHIDTIHKGLETVETLLSTHGIDSLVIDDETEFQDFLEENHQYWDYVDEKLEKSLHGRSRITFYLPEDEEGFSKLAEIRIAIQTLKESKSREDCGTLLMTLENVKNTDWENNWRQYYKPMEVGERLYIVPEWEQIETGDRLPLILEPGLTFGTGSHATTRLCLEELEKYVHGGEQILDLGCGSGILSIAALKLGAHHAVAVDIDETCLHIAYENAALNGIDKASYTVLTGDILADENFLKQINQKKYDIILANIVADTIIALASIVTTLLNPDSVFLCSGIIEDRSQEVIEHLKKNGLSVHSIRSAEGWVAYVCFS